MDWAMLVVGILGLIAAALAAWFAYPGWKALRARPKLRLFIMPGPPTSALFFVRLINEGEGPAADWLVTIVMPRGSRIIPTDPPARGWTDQEVPEGWAVTWMSQGADDTIGPGLHREVLVFSASGDAHTEGRYWIRAARMKEQSGTYLIHIDAERNQAIEMTRARGKKRWWTRG